MVKVRGLGGGGQRGVGADTQDRHHGVPEFAPPFPRRALLRRTLRGKGTKHFGFVIPYFVILRFILRMKKSKIKQKQKIKIKK